MITMRIGDPARADTDVFDLDATFDCGQCFRWEKGEHGTWRGVAMGRLLTVRLEAGMLSVDGAGELDIPMLRRYFDLDRDYGAVLGALGGDPVLARAISFAPGMRVIRQDPWEALCSFIISQNNNIPRIRGIVARLCEGFGDEIAPGAFTFPAPEQIARLSVQELSELRSGFRAAYILDAAGKISGGEVALEALAHLPLDDARRALQTIRGVGPKVADCALLFGCGRLDAFPVDVWIKRVLARFYPGGFPERFARYGGIAQQYLFHYARRSGECDFAAG